MNDWGTMPRHPVEALRNEIDRLTILRDLLIEPPLLALTGLMDELLAEDWQPFNVAWAYHEFASAIVHADAPRVLGDPWRDYLLWAILERGNLFSRKQQSGGGTPVLDGMMSADLHIMQQLFLLDDAMMRDWCRELMRAEVSDDWARWSMSVPSPEYGTGALAQMRAFLVLSEDWGQLVDKIGEYYAGCKASPDLPSAQHEAKA